MEVTGDDVFVVVLNCTPSLASINLIGMFDLIGSHSGRFAQWKQIGHLNIGAKKQIMQDTNNLYEQRF